MSRQIFPVGTVIGFHGLAGAMKVRYTTNKPDLLIGLKSVTVKKKSGETLEALVKSAKLDKGNLILILADYEDRTSAETLMGATLTAKRETLDALDQDEWWIEDLVGLKVFTTEGTAVGTICSIIETNGQLLEIKKDGGKDDDTILVPFVKQLVPVVDVARGRVEIVNLPGLID